MDDEAKLITKIVVAFAIMVVCSFSFLFVILSSDHTETSMKPAASEVCGEYEIVIYSANGDVFRKILRSGKSPSVSRQSLYLRVDGVDYPPSWHVEIERKEENVEKQLQ